MNTPGRIHHALHTLFGSRGSMPSRGVTGASLHGPDLVSLRGNTDAGNLLLIPAATRWTSAAKSAPSGEPRKQLIAFSPTSADGLAALGGYGASGAGILAGI